MNSQINVFTGEKGRQYYQVSNGEVFYDINFPLNIALKCSSVNNSIMGPQHCNNCRDYGAYNDITLLLCLNCAETCYAPSKYERCACDNLQLDIDDQLQHFNSDSDDGFMCMGCGFGTKCNLHLWYSEVDFTTIALSYEHYELVSYKEFIRHNNYAVAQIDFGQIIDNDNISYVEPETDAESSTSSIDCLSSSSAEDIYSIFSIEEDDDDVIDLTKEVCDLTFHYNQELLKLYPLIKQKLQIAIQRREVEETQFEEYDFLNWHYMQLNREYNNILD